MINFPSVASIKDILTKNLMDMHFELMMYGIISITFFLCIVCVVILHERWMKDGNFFQVWGQIFILFITGSIFSFLIYMSVRGILLLSWNNSLI